MTAQSFPIWILLASVLFEPDADEWLGVFKQKLLVAVSQLIAVSLWGSRWCHHRATEEEAEVHER